MAKIVIHDLDDRAIVKLPPTVRTTVFLAMFFIIPTLFFSLTPFIPHFSSLYEDTSSFVALLVSIFSFLFSLFVILFLARSYMGKIVINKVNKTMSYPMVIILRDSKAFPLENISDITTASHRSGKYIYYNVVITVSTIKRPFEISMGTQMQSDSMAKSEELCELLITLKEKWQ